MELLQDELIQASRQLSKEDQRNGHLIPRKVYYKEKLDAAFRLFRSGLEDIATKLKLKGTHDPLEKMAMKIDEARDLEKKGGKNKPCSTLTSLLVYQRELRAMAKALERLTMKLNKPLQTMPSSIQSHEE